MQNSHSKRLGLRYSLPFDPAMLIVTMGLVAFSLLMVYSTTGILAAEKFADPFYFLKRQVLAALLGVFCLIGLTYIRVDWLEKYSMLFFPLALCFAAISLLPGIGDTAGGARRWIGLGPLKFQPGEFAKIFFVVFLAGYYSRHESKIESWEFGIVKPGLMVALIGVPFLLQPDFGSFAVLVAVTLALAFISGIRYRVVLMGLITGIFSMGLLVAVSPYRASRVLSFMSPWQDAEGRGYQLIQSLIAVGSGQWTGVGLGASKQKLFFLPAAHTDFIFAVIAEELGFIGAITLILAFCIIFVRGISIAHKVSHKSFHFLLAIGLTLLIIVPAFLNIGVVTGLLPTKGMVLPLVGYGGSNMIASLCIVGLLMAIVRHERKEL